MRTLVIGTPLPHVTFDNYSFLSSPSFAEYRRLIANIEAVSKVVAEVVSSAAQHKDFAGRPILNASATTDSTALIDILTMRRREAQWVLDNGGIIACFAYPEVAVAGVEGSAKWSDYDWLPSPEGFAYNAGLLPGFGTQGARLLDEHHPFAPYASEFGDRCAYRAVIQDRMPAFEESGRVFLRSPGGVAIGAELKLPEGSVILLPPPTGANIDRSALADCLLRCLDRWSDQRAPKSPEWIRKELS